MLEIYKPNHTIAYKYLLQMAGCHSRCYKSGRTRKKLFRRRAQSTPSSACACLHGLFHGYPGTQPSSPMPPASPTIARARRAPDPLHLLLTVIGRHALHCFFGVHSSSRPCSCYSNAISARTSMRCVRRLLQEAMFKPVACCGAAKRTVGRWLGESTRPDP